jgi:hypothetical protein
MVKEKYWTYTFLCLWVGHKIENKCEEKYGSLGYIIIQLTSHLDGLNSSGFGWYVGSQCIAFNQINTFHPFGIV